LRQPRSAQAQTAGGAGDGITEVNEPNSATARNR
jgi:hypothetical protein